MPLQRISNTDISLTGSFSFPVISGNTVIQATDNTNAALRITQLGTGNALVVEDSANPDSTPFVVTADGNVGIGTNSPSYPLDVNGNLRAGNTIDFGLADANNTIVNVGLGATGNKFAITDYIGDTTYTDFGLRVGRVNDGANGTSRIQHRGTGALSIGAFDAGFVQFLTQNTERMRIDSSGNVGIGISSPGAKLQVAGTSGSPQFLAGTSTNAISLNVNNSGSIYLTSSVTNSTDFTIGTASSIPFVFFTNNTERMRIDSSGNVGIGTSSPAARLQVNAISTTAPSLTWNATAGQILRNENSELAIGLSSTAPYPLYLQGRQNTNASREIVINPLGGNFGIGVTTAGGLLDVGGVFKVQSNGDVFGASGNAGALLFCGGSAYDAGGSIKLFGSSSLNAITFQTGAFAERMRIDGNGNVLVGGTDAFGQPLRRIVVREDATDSTFKGLKVLNAGGTGAVAGIYFQGYDWVQGGIWHGRGASGTVRDGALILGTNPDTSNLSEGGLIGRLKIDNAGRVTMPYQPAFHAHSNGVTPTSGSTLLFQIVDVNIGGHYNSSTATFTAPIAGTYYFYGAVMANTGTGRLYWRMYKNGSFVQYMQAGGDSTNYGEWFGSMTITLAANDYINMILNAGTPYPSNQEQYFGGWLLG